MSKIQIKSGIVNKRIEIVTGMYITLTDHNVLKIAIENPIDVITNLWEDSNKDIQKYRKKNEKYKRNLTENFYKKEKYMSASSKRTLCANARKDLAKFIDRSNKDYAKRLEFMAQFGKCISEINALEMEFANHFKEQIEKLERSIKDE